MTLCPRVQFFLANPVVYWKLTILSLFLHGLFFLKYADSSIQYEFFFTGHSFHEYAQSNQSNTRERKKASQQEQTFFLQCSFLFLRLSVSGLLSKEFMVCRTVIMIYHKI